MALRELADQLHALGVERSGVLLAHISFRTVRPVEGGPLGLIEAMRTALARLVRARDIVGLAVEELRREPLLFLHPSAEGCAGCDAARASTLRQLIPCPGIIDGERS